MVPLTERIRNAVAGHREEMAELTKRLVRIATENPPGRNYRACAEALLRALRALGLRGSIEKIPPPNHLRARGKNEPAPEPRYWVHGSYGNAGPVVYFHGHFDVVPASHPQQFLPRERKGNIFGRGTADMKGGLVAMLYAARALEELKIELRGRIELVFVPDEETGGAGGTAVLFEWGALSRGRALGMLTPEPTGGVIWNASRGALSLRVMIRGKAAHVGLAARGVNAFEKMLVLARALENEKEKIRARRTDFRIQPASARGSILLLGGRSEGGTSFNVVPAVCSFTVDRRINPEENFAAEKKRLLKIFDRARRSGIRLKTEIFQEGESACLPENHSLSRALAESVLEITRRPPEFQMCPGLLETRFYAAQEIPALACGPGRLEVSHGPNEFVSLRSLETCAAVYALTATRLLAKEKHP